MSHKHEITIAVCGPVDAGKSSLIGVLTNGELDNGRGLARSKVLHHEHELSSGRTSSITFNPIKYKNNNGVVCLNSTKSRRKQEAKYIKDLDIRTDNNDEKVVSFIDLAGHEKYFKTTVFGVTGMFPDRGIVVIGANTGITSLTKQHLGTLLYLKIPFIITITKIDLAPKEIYQKLKNNIKRLLKANSFSKIVYFINDDNDTDKYINDMIHNEDIIPVISISNKDGTNINNIHKIIYNTKPREKFKQEENKTVVYLDSNFNVPGIGLVVSGTIKGNNINVKDKLYLGPYNGQFCPVTVRSIHNSIREEVSRVGNGVQGCFAIKFINSKQTISRDEIKKGMVLINNIELFNENITRTFTAKIKVLHHSSTLRTGYCPVIHCGPICQSASIKLLKEEYLKSQDNAIVEFSFVGHKEFIEKDMIFFFRDGTTKGVGTVIGIN
jgi:GTPase